MPDKMLRCKYSQVALNRSRMNFKLFRKSGCCYYDTIYDILLDGRMYNLLSFSKSIYGVYTDIIYDVDTSAITAATAIIVSIFFIISSIILLQST